MIQSMFPNMNFGTLAQDNMIVNKDYSNNNEPQVFIPKRVWNAEYREPTTVQAISIDKIKQAREEIEEYIYYDKYDCINEDMTNWICASEVVEILDKLIESEASN